LVANPRTSQSGTETDRAHAPLGGSVIDVRWRSGVGHEKHSIGM
jgi:hypothetical protein